MRELQRPSGPARLLALALVALALGGCGAGTALRDSFAAQRAYDAGLARYGGGDYGAAAAHFERALALAPRFDDANAHLGWSRYHLGEYHLAMQHFREGLSRQPRWEGLHNGLGWSHYRLEQYPPALAAFREALALDPQYRDAATGLAYSLYALERYEEARDLLERLVREGEGGGFQSPRDDVEQLRARLAWTLYHLEDYPAARTQFVTGLGKHPEWAGLHNGLGWSSLRLGDRTGAAESFRQALRLREDFEDAREGLALSMGALAR